MQSIEHYRPILPPPARPGWLSGTLAILVLVIVGVVSVGSLVAIFGAVIGVAASACLIVIDLLTK